MERLNAAKQTPIHVIELQEVFTGPIRGLDYEESLTEPDGFLLTASTNLKSDTSGILASFKTVCLLVLYSEVIKRHTSLSWWPWVASTQEQTAFCKSLIEQ